MPTVKKTIPYKLRTLGSVAMLGAASLIVLNSCQKDEDPIDTYKQELDQLIKQYRIAIIDAKTKPWNISTTFDAWFNENKQKAGIDTPTAPDSAKITQTDEFRDGFRKFEEYGNPESMDNLKDVSTQLVKKIKER
jgi:hypothetical protein